jgi:hypothetical protein
MATNNAVNTTLSGQSGSGNFVGAQAPTLVAPVLGTPTSGTLTNCIGLPISTGVSGLGTGVATALAAGVTGSGDVVLVTSPTLVTPILGAAVATSLSFNPTTGGIIGTTNADNATAGDVGQEISSVVASASAVSLTANTPANVTSISLTAGDWDVFGNITTIVNLGTGNTFVWCSLTSATLPDASLYNIASVIGGTTALGTVGLNTPFLRVNVSTTTTVYLSVQCGFPSGTASACGGIYARRRR